MTLWNSEKNTYWIQKLSTEASMLQCFLATDQAVLERVVHPPHVFGVNVTFCWKPSYLASEFGGETRCVEFVNQRNATHSLQKLVVEHVHIVSKHRYTTQSRDHNSLLGVFLSPWSTYCCCCCCCCCWFCSKSSTPYNQKLKQKAEIDYPWLIVQCLIIKHWSSTSLARKIPENPLVIIDHLTKSNSMTRLPTQTQSLDYMDCSCTILSFSKVKGLKQSSIVCNT